MDDFLEVHAIEQEFLKPETIATPEQTFSWAQKNPDIEIFIRDTATGKVVGSLTVVPLNKEQFDKFTSGTLQDTELSAETLEQYRDNTKYWMLFSAVGIRKSYQGRGLFSMLMHGFCLKMKELQSRGIVFKNICGEGQTPDGQRLLEKIIGLKRIEGDFEFPLFWMGAGDQTKATANFLQCACKRCS